MPMKAAPKSLVLGTHNRGKIDEIKQLLSGLDLRLLTGTDLNMVLPDVEEDADTLYGNARKKAETILASTGIPSLADDTGLEVQALGGKPGVLSARYAGDECDPASNRSKLLDELRDVANRSAAFRTVIALADSDGTVVFEGRCDGRITLTERGAGGFGYDAIFEPEGGSLTFAEMTREDKNKISHRARALRKLREYLERGARV